MSNETASSQRPADPPLLRSTSSGRGDCIPTVFCGRGGSVEFAEEHVAGSSQETDDGHLTAETTFPQAVDCDLKGAQSNSVHRACARSFESVYSSWSLSQVRGEKHDRVPHR